MSFFPHPSSSFLHRQGAVCWASAKHWHPIAKQVHSTMQKRLEGLSEADRADVLDTDGGRKIGFDWIDIYDVDSFIG